MRQSVREAFVHFTEGFEGSVPWMYLDVKGLVTTAIGNLVDPLGLAMNLPWTIKGPGLPASDHEVETEWRRVKAMQVYKLFGGGHRVFRDSAKLLLTEDGIQRVVGLKLEQNDTYLRARFPSFGSWPADAQLATHSMAWACGPAFRFPRLASALEYLDFEAAARECTIDDSNNRGVIPRNAANVVLYRNAAVVLSKALDPEPLRYPAALARDFAPEEPTDVPLTKHIEGVLDAAEEQRRDEELTRLEDLDELEDPRGTD